MNLVYRYGLQATTIGKDLVRDLMRMAHRHANMLTEIERGRREAMREMEAEAGLVAAMTVFDAASTAVLEIVREIKAHKSLHRTTKMPDDMRLRLADRKSVASAARATLREVRRRLHEEDGVVSRRDEINTLAADLRRSARTYSGLSNEGPYFGAWGTYQLVEKAAECARAKLSLYDIDYKPNGPRFRRFVGEGSVGVQIDGGLTVGDLATHGQIQIVPRVRQQSQSLRRNPANVGKLRHDSRASRGAATLRLRVGATEARGRGEAIWAEWPMILHRPLPADAQIMAAAVHVRRTATWEEWSVTITIRTEGSRVVASRAGAVAINFGWRRVETGVRVAAWVGEDGGSGTIVVDNGVLDRLHHAEGIRALRDMLFDVARPWTAQMLTDLGDLAPEWLRAATSTLAAWKSQERLSSVAYRWSQSRFPGDDAAFAALDEWRRRDRHLWQYEAGERAGAIRHRREEFRIAAAHLAARYTTLVHDGVDLAKLKTCPMLEADSDNPRARSNMHAAAPGWLREAMVNAFRGDVAEVDGVNATHTCPDCGAVEEFDAAIQISHRCGVCGVLWDQDWANARNLLARYDGERRSAESMEAPAYAAETAGETVESPRARSKRKAKERAERITARKSNDKAAE